MKKQNKQKEKKIQFGHLWDKNTGWGTGWSGWDGTFTCKRCLAVLKASRPNNSSPYEYEWMKNMQGKKVPKKDWHKCPSDDVYFEKDVEFNKKGNKGR